MAKRRVGKEKVHRVSLRKASYDALKEESKKRGKSMISLLDGLVIREYGIGHATVACSKQLDLEELIE